MLLPDDPAAAAVMLRLLADLGDLGLIPDFVHTTGLGDHIHGVDLTVNMVQYRLFYSPRLVEWHGSVAQEVGRIWAMMLTPPDPAKNYAFWHSRKGLDQAEWSRFIQQIHEHLREDTAHGRPPDQRPIPKRQVPRLPRRKGPAQRQGSHGAGSAVGVRAAAPRRGR